MRLSLSEKIVNCSPLFSVMLSGSVCGPSGVVTVVVTAGVVSVSGPVVFGSVVPV